MKKLLIIITILLVSVKCSKQKLNYTISDMSSLETPKWIFDYNLQEKDSDYEYFIGESEDFEKELCKKNASLNAVEKIVTKILDKIISDDKYKNNHKHINIIKDKIRLNISNIENVDSYWEQKKYKKSLGAREDEKVYNCYKVIKIKSIAIKQIIDSIK